MILLLKIHSINSLSMASFLVALPDLFWFPLNGGVLESSGPSTPAQCLEDGCNFCAGDSNNLCNTSICISIEVDSSTSPRMRITKCSQKPIASRTRQRKVWSPLSVHLFCWVPLFHRDKGDFRCRFREFLPPSIGLVFLSAGGFRHCSGKFLPRSTCASHLTALFAAYLLYARGAPSILQSVPFFRRVVLLADPLPFSRNV
ncbi:hypothetical protein R1flu_001854 [Riccia fluitans]|uniref:Secreted protein n=1 Tax=Riccia fluitans TaxID=41844 RepID=A0ABD1Y8F5_9MARC